MTTGKTNPDVRTQYVLDEEAFLSPSTPGPTVIDGIGSFFKEGFRMLGIQAPRVPKVPELPPILPAVAQTLPIAGPAGAAGLLRGAVTNALRTVGFGTSALATAQTLRELENLSHGKESHLPLVKMVPDMPQDTSGPSLEVGLTVGPKAARAISAFDTTKDAVQSPVLIPAIAGAGAALAAGPGAVVDALRYLAPELAMATDQTGPASLTASPSIYIEEKGLGRPLRRAEEMSSRALEAARQAEALEAARKAAALVQQRLRTGESTTVPPRSTPQQPGRGGKFRPPPPVPFVDFDPGPGDGTGGTGGGRGDTNSQDTRLLHPEEAMDTGPSGDTSSRSDTLAWAQRNIHGGANCKKQVLDWISAHGFEVAPPPDWDEDCKKVFERLRSDFRAGFRQSKRSGRSSGARNGGSHSSRARSR